MFGLTRIFLIASLCRHPVNGLFSIAFAHS
jgi:hypothetical protein